MSKFSFSLTNLITNLLGQHHEEEYSILPSDDVKPTTIRLEPAVRKFCDVQSSKMGISIQSFISMVLHGVMLESKSPVTSELTLMYERFFELFKSHDVPLAYIPVILKDFNITLSILSDRGRLLDAYSDSLIKFLSKTFYVDESYLYGKSHYTCDNAARWYKMAYEFCDTLLDMKQKNQKPRLILIKPDFYSNKNAHTEIPVKVIVRGEYYYENKFFYFYKTAISQPWSYDKCRLVLKAIVLFCYLFDIDVLGYAPSQDLFDELDASNGLFVEKFHENKMRAWRPSDFIDEEENEGQTIELSPELKGIYGYFFRSQLDRLIENKEKLKTLYESFYYFDKALFKKIMMRKSEINVDCYPL